MMKIIKYNNKTKHSKSRAQPEKSFLAFLDKTIKTWLNIANKTDEIATSVKNKLYQILKLFGDAP